MADEGRVREGFLVIADITGYTSFFTGTELEHAQEIMEELTSLVVQRVKPPLKLVKLEGDGVFYYALETAYPEPDRLLDHIEATYADFADQLAFMRCSDSACTCAACANIESLDLKFLAHYGQFIPQKVQGTADDLAGPDVILVHRLLKNSIESATGLKAYAFITDPCHKRTGGLTGIEHAETYEHIGEVRGRVHDLRTVYESTKDTRKVFIEPGQADVVLEHEFEASPELLWSFFLDPQRRLQWQGYTYKVEVKRNQAGRMGEGSETHCGHGAFSRTSRMVDMRPFRYFTVHSIHRPAWMIPPGHVTFEFTPLENDRTRVSLRVRLTKRDKLTLLATRMVATAMLAREYRFDRLDRILANYRGIETGELRRAESPSLPN